MPGHWSIDPLPQLDGARIIVTGANSGLGFETVRTLARTNAEVTLACRNVEQASAAAQQILAEHPSARLVVRQLDLASLGSIYRFAEDFLAQTDGLDLLVNNAGVMALPRMATRDGFEMQIGVNHLGHFALTARLFPALEKLAGSRVVTVSSLMHKRGRIDLDDLNWKTRYSKWQAYAQSKLANLMFALELDRRLRGREIDVLSLAAHPGYAATNLQFRGPELSGSSLGRRMMAVSNGLFAQSQARGAEPTLRAATADDVESGEFYGPSGFLELRGSPVAVGHAEQAGDIEVARRLWLLSEELTGITLP